MIRPLYFHLLSESQKKFAKERLLKALENYRWRLGTGFLSTPLILDVLAEYDLEAAYRVLENEEMLGWLFRVMCGINVDGENHFIIAPRPGGHFTHAKTDYTSVFGKVVCGWKKENDGSYTYEIEVPANTTVTVILPSQDAVELNAGRYSL